MREQLIQYVELLFAGAPNTEEIKQEILQNTLDRYDDLVEQGKSPEAAYRLAISGIGDINEILSSVPAPEPAVQPPESMKQTQEQPVQNPRTSPAPEKRQQGIGKGNMILIAMITIFALMLLAKWVDNDAVLSLYSIGAIVIVILLVLEKKPGKSGNTAPVVEKDEIEDKEETEEHPETGLQKSVGAFIWVIGLAAYLIVSFATHAWYVTWVIFLLTAGVSGLMHGYMVYQLGDSPAKARKVLRRGINSFIWMVGLSVYFLLSFSTNAWAITWLVFPVIGSICGLFHACFDLKEAIENEN